MPDHPSFLPSMPAGEPLPGKTYRADGWAYLNVNWTTPEDWNAMLTHMGDELVVLISTRAHVAGALKVRGQVLISPAGIDIFTRSPW